MRELMIENQCTWSSVASRYVSHRDAQRMSLALNTTSYVKMT